MERKQRIAIPEDVAAIVLYRADRRCCVCREPRKAVQIHHLDDDPANNALDNLAVLCLQCHNDTQLKGGFDRKLDAAQVLLYRDGWSLEVERRRALLLPADQLSDVPLADDAVREHDSAVFRRSQDVMSEAALNELLETLWHQDTFLGDDAAIVGRYAEFWRAIDNELIDAELRERCEAMRLAFDELLKFLRLNFFRADLSSETHPRYVMHPGLNTDREGSGSIEDESRYHAYQKQLETLVESAWTAWKEFRRAVKRRLAV